MKKKQGFIGEPLSFNSGNHPCGWETSCSRKRKKENVYCFGFKKVTVFRKRNLGLLQGILLEEKECSAMPGKEQQEIQTAM